MINYYKILILLLFLSLFYFLFSFFFSKVHQMFIIRLLHNFKMCINTCEPDISQTFRERFVNIGFVIIGTCRDRFVSSFVFVSHKKVRCYF